MFGQGAVFGEDLNGEFIFVFQAGQLATLLVAQVSGHVVGHVDRYGYDLFVHDTTTGEEIRRLTTTGSSAGVHNLYPDVSPDGKLVAFSAQANAEAVADLYVIRVDGTGLAKVTNSPDSSEIRPSWSPDGTQLAFMGKDGDSPTWDIYVVDVFG